LHRQRAAGWQEQEAYIWVGALTDDGTELAGYSHSAGEMGRDFIVAHDDILSAGDGAGTSHAAPRVTGAAALIRHKFPGLSGMQLKDLLLSTAEDMGEPGVDTIFGHGKLDLNNALSPQGQLAAD
jgi:subtilisin family serine protease